MTRATNLLFSNGSLADSLEHHLHQIVQSVEEWNEEDLLSRPDSDIADLLVEKYSVAAPVLDKANISQEPVTETYVEEMQFGERIRIKHTLVTIVVPYSGESDVFRLQPNPHGWNPPRGTLTATALKLSWSGPGHDVAAAKQSLDEQLTAVESWLANAAQNIAAFNQQARTHALQHVARRKAVVLANRDLEASIGYPVVKRPDAASYSFPMRRKKIDFPRVAPAGPFRPEPAIAEAHYEEALRVLVNARNGLERSPSTTAKLGEEDIRNLLLVTLNGQFEGAAAGEVFNCTGKTDILIRVEDRHVFIGECKIWKGPKTITDTIDQLLGYLTWRDTKAAVLLFVRDGSLSEITPKAVAKFREHANFKRNGVHDEFGERHDFVLHANGDTAREIKIAFMPFVLPR
jgi:hypothetical protein